MSNNKNILTFYETIKNKTRIYSVPRAFWTDQCSQDDETCENQYTFYDKSYKQLIYTLPQALFAQIDVRQIMKSVKTTINYEQVIKTTNLYSAAGDLCPNKCSKIIKMCNSRSLMNKPYKKLISTLPQALFAQIDVQQIMKNEKVLKINEQIT